MAEILTSPLAITLYKIGVVFSALMGGVSGSAIADAAMQSRMLGGEMVKRGFTRGFAAGVAARAAIRRGD